MFQNDTDGLFKQSGKILVPRAPVSILSFFGNGLCNCRYRDKGHEEIEKQSRSSGKPHIHIIGAANEKFMPVNDVPTA